MTAAAPRRVRRHAVARRFSCPPCAAWRLFQAALYVLGGLSALLALSLQVQARVPAPAATLVAWATTTGVALLLLAGGWGVRRFLRSSRTAAAMPLGILRWDARQWAWQSAGAGAPFAVTPVVLLDLERWMLLVLVPADGPHRFWRHRFLPLSRRHHGGDWSLLRVHLFLARE